MVNDEEERDGQQQPTEHDQRDTLGVSSSIQERAAANAHSATDEQDGGSKNGACTRAATRKRKERGE